MADMLLGNWSSRLPLEEYAVASAGREAVTSSRLVRTLRRTISPVLARFNAAVDGNGFEAL